MSKRISPLSLFLLSASLNGVEVGDANHGTDDGAEHNPTGHDAEQEVLEGGREPGPGCLALTSNFPLLFDPGIGFVDLTGNGLKKLSEFGIFFCPAKANGIAIETAEVEAIVLPKSHLTLPLSLSSFSRFGLCKY
ncbi:hypothetical protein EUGRSUZ_C03562 [Eucalyptus grandis]|uniref:Uncharacterized protein n=2 Tax=Eucalyptus grandis TaxID=71139 RepID=A0ACC3LJD1_EUCGR|nr:hypothetical protein EUGRSUZ_C03562 [Eucalyptus grandis]